MIMGVTMRAVALVLWQPSGWADIACKRPDMVPDQADWWGVGAACAIDCMTVPNAVLAGADGRYRVHEREWGHYRACLKTERLRYLRDPGIAGEEVCY